VKELKVSSAGAMLALIAFMWNPVKELKVHLLFPPHERVAHAVESGEGIEREALCSCVKAPVAVDVESGEGIERLL